MARRTGKSRAGRAFVAAAALGAGVTVAALGARRPVIRRWPASVLQAGPCLPASEAPGVLSALCAAGGVVAGVAASVPAVRARRRPAVAGIVAAALNALAVAALADLRRDAERSARVFDAALSDLPVPPGPVTSRPRPADVVLAGRRARAAHLRAADVAYGPDPAQRLDVWAPPDLPPGAAAPVLVQVHGGGWTTGDKAVSAAPLLGHLVGAGWVCVTIDYRLAPGHRLLDMIADVKRALAWVRAHVAEYGGDPGFVALSGGSAGGHLASITGLTAHDRSFQPGFEDADTSVAAVVPVYGVHDFSVDEHGLADLLRTTVIGASRDEAPETWRRTSPLHRVRRHAATPPFLVIHGSTDTIVSAGQSRRFVARLREAGAEVRHAELPRAQHGFDSWPTERTAHHVRAVHRFLAAVHARHRVPAAAGQPETGVTSAISFQTSPSRSW